MSDRVAAGQGETRELLERFLRWWLAFPGRPLRDLGDDDERNRRVVEGVDEFMVYNKPKAVGQGETAEQAIDLDRLRRQVMSAEEAAEVAAAVERLLVRVQEEANERARAEVNFEVWMEQAIEWERELKEVRLRVQELTDERDLAIDAAQASAKTARSWRDLHDEVLVERDEALRRVQEAERARNELASQLGTAMGNVQNLVGAVSLGVPKGHRGRYLVERLEQAQAFLRESRASEFAERRAVLGGDGQQEGPVA